MSVRRLLRVMPSNSGKALIHYLAGKHPGALGHLYAPGGQRGPFAWLPYALDNGAWPAFKNGRAWDGDAYGELLGWAERADAAPLWLLVPDKVGDRDETLRLWDAWYAPLARLGWPLAFAAQDGMTPADVPGEAEVIFVGGTYEWKWRAAPELCAAFPRVHVGRVNSPRRLWQLLEWGAESCDGTGWNMGDRTQTQGLVHFLEHQAHGLGRSPFHAPTLFGGSEAA